MSIKPHVFVVMPQGSQKDAEGRLVHFERVFEDYIRPALTMAGFEVFRAEGEPRPGEIKPDLLQELLLADLVVADLTLGDPRVWYELGVRHALRARGVVLVSGGITAAFEGHTDRRLRYTLRDGAPDAACLESDQRKLSIMAKATMDSWHGRKISPVHSWLPDLREPDWRALRVVEAREFWERHAAWETRVETARNAGRVGDVLVLADEAPVAAFRADAWFKAGEALRKDGHFEQALEVLERCADIDPNPVQARRDIGVCLQRLGTRGVAGHSLERARAHYHAMLKDHPDDVETWALLGKLDQDAWIGAWRRLGRTPRQMREDAGYEDALLRAAIDSYESGFRRQPAHHTSGINAVILMKLFGHLTGDARYELEAGAMAGVVRYAARNETDEGQAFRALATLAELEVLCGSVDSVERAYRDAVARNEGDGAALESSRDSLMLMRTLGFRCAEAEAGLGVLNQALANLRLPGKTWQPRHVLLFSGHMIDAPDRPAPRFPANKEPIAASRIVEALEKLGAGDADLALTQGACGGDLLFTEACLARGVRVRWMWPFPESEFVERSVACCGGSWRDRFYAAQSRITEPARVAPVELGEPPQGAGEDYAYERCNTWLLHTALAHGANKVRLVCLWNGGGGEVAGGTGHMYAEMKRRSGQVTWIDTRREW